ncbi:hypothetical protein [Oligoflexus tunisiensis]|uniref:hypothetical protein n=1 Tax=Oligoflexus tunisiensis TaxID=708132 RepID=UPI00114D14AB|nr:hypothetical protein [Oligoflexus tunisiensis]
MWNSIAFALLLLAAPTLHGQETSSETVTVTGSRLPYTTPGPIAGSTGGPNPDMPCAEPNCGQPPEDPSGGGAITQAQKDQQNKQNQEKARSDGRVKQAIQATQDLIAAVKKWFSKSIDIGIGVETYERSYYPNNGGVKNEKGWCASAHGSMGTPNPNYEDPCVEVEAQPEVVKRNNGVLENQVRMTYVVYNECYFDKTCGPKYYSFIAGSQGELDRLLNGVLQ